MLYVFRIERGGYTVRRNVRRVDLPSYRSMSFWFYAGFRRHYRRHYHFRCLGTRRGPTSVDGLSHNDVVVEVDNEGRVERAHWAFRPSPFRRSPFHQLGSRHRILFMLQRRVNQWRSKKAIARLSRKRDELLRRIGEAEERKTVARQEILDARARICDARRIFRRARLSWAEMIPHDWNSYSVQQTMRQMQQLRMNEWQVIAQNRQAFDAAQELQNDCNRELSDVVERINMIRRNRD